MESVDPSKIESTQAPDNGLDPSTSEPDTQDCFEFCLAVAPNMRPCIIGPKGATKLRIEKDNGVKITVPPSDNLFDETVSVRGPPCQVEAAVSYILTLLDTEQQPVHHNNITSQTPAVVNAMAAHYSPFLVEPVFDMPLPAFNERDRRDILGKRWLSDDVIDLAQAIVQRHRPDIRGLYACGAAFTLDSLDPADGRLFIQIINRGLPSTLSSMAGYCITGGSHWLLVSNYGARAGCLHLYDSMYSSASQSTAQLTHHLLSQYRNGSVVFPKVQQQDDNYSCGLFAIAFMFSVAAG